MRTHLLFLSSLLGLFALADVALAGRGGDDKREERGPAPTGSGSFRPAPAPRVESPRVEPNFSRPPVQEYRAPRVEPSRAPNPVIERYQKPAVVEERRAPVSTGNATVLPSVSTQYRPPVTNAFRQPTVPAPATQPNTRAEERDDFLGMHEEPKNNRGFVPNHFLPQTAPAATNRAATAIVAPQKSFEEVARHSILPNPPGRPARPPRPALTERWQAASNNYSNQANHWRQTNAANIATFQATRGARWSQIQQHQTAAAWRGQYHSPQYRQWRNGLWDYRRARAEEIWADSHTLYENLFNNYWWSTCWWRRGRWNVAADVPPWWWWLPATWAEESAFFGPGLGSAPIDYDPGDNVYYDGDNYDVNGQDEGSATDARDQAIALANPQVDDVPIPEPAPDGQAEQWLPLGAWALTQQEQGDPTLYFQLSVNKDGIVGGGYKNALTGDEQPIVGQVNKQSQRIAWHIANAPQTVFETGLSSLDYDVASVFLHFNGTSTQTWLLVRLPSPEMPPGPVQIPNEAD